MIRKFIYVSLACSLFQGVVYFFEVDPENDYCSDVQHKEILSELHKSQGVISCTHLDFDEQDENKWADAAVTVGSATAAGIAAPTAATAGLSWLGFTSSGIAANSIAAGMQAVIGNVGGGTIFATLQSIGASGGFATLGPVGIGAAAVVGGAVATVKYFQSGAEEEEKQRRRQERERIRQMKIANGTAVKGIDICEECWAKMKLRERCFAS